MATYVVLTYVVRVVLHTLISLCWQNIVLDYSITSAGSIQTRLSGLNARAGSVRYNSLVHQAVQQKCFGNAMFHHIRYVSSTDEW